MIGDFELLAPLARRPGRLVLRARFGELPAHLHLAHPPSRLSRPDSAFAGAAAELFGPGAPACGVRFEGRVLGHLAGLPGVPRWLGAGVHDGAGWFAHAAVEGPTLAEAPRDPVATARALLAILEGIHGRGVVLRDLHAGAVRVTEKGLVITDFEAATLGSEGIPGAVGPSAPEHVARALGAPIEPDHRVDLYALGRLLAALDPAPRPTVAHLIDVLVRPLPGRPVSAAHALAVLDGAPAPAPPAPTRFVEALRQGDPEAALALARAAGEPRRVAHLAAALGHFDEAWVALAAVGTDTPELALLAFRAGAGGDLADLLESARDFSTLAQVVEVALASASAAGTDPSARARPAADAQAAYGLAVAAAARAAAFDAAVGSDLLRHVTGRLLAIEVRVGALVAEPLVAACAAQALVGEGREPPATVRRAWARAVEAGAPLIHRVGGPGLEAGVLLAAAGAALGAPWTADLVGWLARAGLDEAERADLRAAARARLGLSGSSTPATPW